MPIESDQRLIGTLQSLSRSLAGVVALLALIVLAGWTFNLDFLKSLVPGTGSMNANTAICLVLASFALLLGCNPSTVWSRRVARACVGLVMLIALIVLSQYITGLNLGIDLLFFRPPQSSVLSPQSSLRMAPNTALNFILGGIAILLFLGKSPKGYLWAQVITLATGLIALLALTGSAFDVNSFISRGLVAQMSVNTALGFILLSVALLLMQPEHGLVSPISSPHAGGTMARRLSLAVIAVPVVLGLLVGVGFHAGLYGQQVGASLIVTLGVLVLLALVWQAATSLNEADAERGQAELASQKREAQYRAVVEDQTESIARILPDGTLTFVNAVFARQHGQRPEKLIGRSFLTLPYMTDTEREALHARLSCLTWEHPVGVVDSCSVMPNGERRWYQWTMRALFDEQQRFVEFQVVGLDITERKSIEEQLEHQAFHDALTGLPNRVLFRDRLSHALARARRNGSSVAVLFLDLDNFKVINDSLGHKVGDELLVVVSQRLQECVRAEDTIARLGGDEFTILLEDITDFHRAVAIAERIGEQLQVAVALGGPDQLRTTSTLETGHLERHLFITSSIGIAMQSSAYEQPEDLLRNADIAMYEAKSKGKARFEIFERSMTSRFTEHLELETDLRRALEREEFRVYYQPIVKLGNGRITELEALIRWEHPDRRLVPPAEFIPAAEQTGLIVPIGKWVLEQACRQTLEWQKQFPREPHEQSLGVSVNLSARQFQHPQLIDEIAQVVRSSGLDPRHLKLEITESIGMDDVNSASATLWKLKDLGLHLALDDFGTGYSALSYLKNFPFDTLKLDRAFVDGLGFDPEDTAIVHAAIAFAKALGLSVTAEGIETREQVVELQKLGCDHGQGYYFARPMTSAAISVLLANPPWIRAQKSKVYQQALQTATSLVATD